MCPFQIRTARLFAVSFACLALAGAPVPQGSTEAPSDTELRQAWERLQPAQRRDVAEWFTAEAEGLDTFQAGLIRHVIATENTDVGSYPLATPAAHYTCAEHSPADIIPRKWLDPEDARARKQREIFLATVPERRLDSAFRYDYGGRRIVRSADDLDPERIFANALRGLSPGIDLVEAIVEKALDDGSQQVVLAAFDHAYTDRDGNVYPGLTLYDAWASGAGMEMPDVDNLGIIHDVLGLRERWIAPLPASQHDAVYEAVGELFAAGFQHRALRHALARCYLIGSPRLRDGYAFHLDRFHSLWDSCASDPAKLLPALPSPEELAQFLEKNTLRVEKTPALLRAGRARHRKLEEDAASVKQLLIGVLREYGAFVRVVPTQEAGGERAASKNRAGR